MMCNFMAFAVTKTRNVFFSKNSSSHEVIIREYNLNDSKHPSFKTFCRVLIQPPNGDYSTPIDCWEFKIDQPEKPDWFTKKHEESVWAVFKRHVHDFLKINCTFELKAGLCVAVNSTITKMEGGTL